MVSVQYRRRVGVNERAARTQRAVTKLAALARKRRTNQARPVLI